MTFNRPFFQPDGAGDGGSGGSGTGGGTSAGTAEGGGSSGTGGTFDPNAAAAAAVEAQASAGASGGSGQSTVDWNTVVPEDLRDKPWVQELLKNENPGQQLFKQMGELQTKLGSRPEGIPKADSPKEEWDKFYNSMGRPETAEGYETPKTEWPEEMKGIGEFVNAAAGDGNDAYTKALKEVAHELGIPKDKFSAAYNKLNMAFANANKEFFEQAAQAKADADKDYATKFTEKFGAKAVEIQGNAAKILKATLGEEGEKVVNAMSNEEMVRLAWVLDNVRAKYISEDTLSREGGGATVMSDGDKRTAAMKLMADPAYDDFQDPRHKQVVNECRKLYGLPPLYKD